MLIIIAETRILGNIIKKGGLMGKAAEMYINTNKAGQFIYECSAQCHNKQAVDLWGKELVLEIKFFTSNRNKRKMEGFI